MLIKRPVIIKIVREQGARCEIHSRLLFGRHGVGHATDRALAAMAAMATMLGLL